MKYLTVTNFVWLALYLAIMSVGLWQLHRAHVWAITSHEAASDEGKKRQSDWDDWRKTAAEQANGKGPVSRRIPKSAEPPTLVLLRDYYGMCLSAFLLFGSVLFFVSMIFVRGIFSPAPARR